MSTLLRTLAAALLLAVTLATPGQAETRRHAAILVEPDLDPLVRTYVDAAYARGWLATPPSLWRVSNDKMYSGFCAGLGPAYADVIIARRKPTREETALCKANRIVPLRPLRREDQDGVPYWITFKTAHRGMVADFPALERLAGVAPPPGYAKSASPMGADGGWSVHSHPAPIAADALAMIEPGAGPGPGVTGPLPPTTAHTAGPLPDLPLFATRAFWFADGGAEPSALGAGAYGMIAFTSRATSTTRPRHMAVCEAFVAGLSSLADADLAGIPQAKRMVTFWPTNAPPDAPPAWDDCDGLVDSYFDLPARQAIRAAEASPFVEGSGLRTPLASRRGPFLIAWTPPEGSDSERVWIVLDLSRAETPEQIQQMMRDYRLRIEQAPDLWGEDGGFRRDTLRANLRYFLNRYGEAVMAFFGAGDGE